VFVAVAALAACTDAGPVSGPGTVDAILISPNGAEGAALVVLSGDGLGAAVVADARAAKDNGPARREAGRGFRARRVR
jgi:hypothetical protein